MPADNENAMTVRMQRLTASFFCALGFLVSFCDTASIYNENGHASVALKRVVSDTSKVANLTRRHNGDVFYSYGEFNFIFFQDLFQFLSPIFEINNQ